MMLGQFFKSLQRYSGALAVLVAIPAAAFAVIQCASVSRDVDRAEALARMTREMLVAAHKTTSVQSSIAGSAERATQASIQAMTASESASLRSASAAERSANAAEQSVRLLQESVRLQKDFYQSQARK